MIPGLGTRVKANSLDTSLWQLFTLTKCIKLFMLPLLYQLCQISLKRSSGRKETIKIFWFPHNLFTSNCISHVLSNWAWLSEQRSTCHSIFCQQNLSLTGCFSLHQSESHTLEWTASCRTKNQSGKRRRHFCLPKVKTNVVHLCCSAAFWKTKGN